MRALTATLVPLAVAAVFAAVLPVGCSDAETPDAYFDGGYVDAGRRGLRNEPCLEGGCINEDVDICVQQGSGANATLICREICDPTFNDPCGLGRRCRPLDNGTAACLPANGLDESCPCDDGLACVSYTEPADPIDLPDGGQIIDAGIIVVRDVCKTSCTITAGEDDCAVGTCRLFTGSAVNGVCIE